MAEKILKKPPMPAGMIKGAVTSISIAPDRTGIYMDSDQFLQRTYSEDQAE